MCLVLMNAKVVILRGEVWWARTGAVPQHSDTPSPARVSSSGCLCGDAQGTLQSTTTRPPPPPTRNTDPLAG